jgi:hypothetical protein
MSEQEVAWTAMPYRAPVLDSAGNEIGTTESLMGDEDEDIFHGVAVRLKHHGRMVEVVAESVRRITASRVYTTVPPDKVASLPDYKEQRWLHIGWGGLFRKHPEWEQR